MEKRQRHNEEIRISPVRLIDQQGEMLGILPTEEALAKARDADLDLVEVGPNERPPVCRIMDYGKYKYEQKKRSSVAKKRSHQMQIKEVRVRPKTDEHDLQVKLDRAKKFLEHKDKVLVNVLFRGRELAHRDIGVRLLQWFAEELEEHGKIEKAPGMEGRRMTMIVAPK